MNEAETRAELIDPKLKACDWGVVAGSKILRERDACKITAGRIQVDGGRGKALIADYILVYKGIKLAVVEAIASLEIKNNKHLNNEYLYYYLTFFDWDAETKGDVKVKGKTLNKAKLKEMRVFIPPLPEQKQIVKNLDAISAETKKLETIYQQKINDLDELKKSILQKAFNGEL